MTRWKYCSPQAEATGLAASLSRLFSKRQRIGLGPDGAGAYAWLRSFVDIDNGGELSLSWPQVRLEGHMSVPTFDIFRGSLNNGAIRIESADALSSAVKLMKECAKSRPGSYFVFDVRNHKTLASTDTSPKLKRKPPLHWFVIL